MSEKVLATAVIHGRTLTLTECSKRIRESRYIYRSWSTFVVRWPAGKPIVNTDDANAARAAFAAVVADSAVTSTKVR